jgi:hypothetical protein
MLLDIIRSRLDVIGGIQYKVNEDESLIFHKTNQLWVLFEHSDPCRMTIIIGNYSIKLMKNRR